MRKESVMNTTAENTVITEQSGAVQLIELNRPDKSNAVTFAMYDDLTAAISAAEQDSAIRVMLIHGRGDSFTAGNDLGDFLHSSPTSADLPPVRFLRAITGDQANCRSGAGRRGRGGHDHRPHGLPAKAQTAVQSLRQRLIETGGRRAGTVEGSAIRASATHGPPAPDVRGTAGRRWR